MAPANQTKRVLVVEWNEMRRDLARAHSMLRAQSAALQVLSQRVHILSQTMLIPGGKALGSGPTSSDHY